MSQVTHSFFIILIPLGLIYSNYSSFLLKSVPGMNRQPQPEHRAFAGVAFRIHRSLVEQGNVADNGKAQAGACFAVGAGF